jgi:hypothetical protein
MLEVDQFFAQVEDALGGERAALFVLELSFQPVGKAAADRKHEIEGRRCIEGSGYDAEQRNAGKTSSSMRARSKDPGSIMLAT